MALIDLSKAIIGEQDEDNVFLTVSVGLCMSFSFEEKADERIVCL